MLRILSLYSAILVNIFFLFLFVSLFSLEWYVLNEIAYLKSIVNEIENVYSSTKMIELKEIAMLCMPNVCIAQTWNMEQLSRRCAFTES